MQLWRALRVTAGRAGGLKSQGLEPPFVGRDRELRLAKELFHASADEHKAHLLSITGIAGIGKSRLAWELYKYLDGISQDVAWHRGRCLAYGDGVTYWALAEMVRMRAGIAEGEDDESAWRSSTPFSRALSKTPRNARGSGRASPSSCLSRGARTSSRPSCSPGGVSSSNGSRSATRSCSSSRTCSGPMRRCSNSSTYLLEWSRNHAILVVALARPGSAEDKAHGRPG